MNRKIFSVLIVAFLMACSTEVDYLPFNLFDYELERRLEGEEANSFVNKLHFNPVTDHQNQIGFYKSGYKNLTIYITDYPDQISAEKDELKMTNKISHVNSVFVAGKYIKLNNKKIYECFGMGQAHYVFSANSKLFWISVDAVEGKDFVNNYLNTIEES